MIQMNQKNQYLIKMKKNIFKGMNIRRLLLNVQIICRMSIKILNSTNSKTQIENIYYQKSLMI